MRTPFLLALSAVFGATAVTATEFKLPAAKPAVSVEIEDSWKPEYITRGVQAQTPDRNAYLAVEATSDPKEMTTIIDASDAMLKTRKVTLDRSTRRDSPFKLKNFPAEEIVFTGFDLNGPVTVSFTFVTLPNCTMVFTYWASATGHLEHEPELGKIFDSIKIVKPTATPAATP